MNEDYDKTFKHLMIRPDDLLKLLNIDGRATSIFTEDGGNWLHINIQMEDGTGVWTQEGGYVDASVITEEILEFDEHTSIHRRFFGEDVLESWTVTG